MRTRCSVELWLSGFSKVPASRKGREGVEEFLTALGVRVIEVPGLEEGAVYVEQRDILLIDPDMSPRRRDWTARWAMTLVGEPDQLRTAAHPSGDGSL